jgi:hypothetical protein
VNDENDASILENLSAMLYNHTRLQARADAIPWTPDAEDDRLPNSNELAFAPSLSLQYHMVNTICQYEITPEDTTRSKESGEQSWGVAESSLQSSGFLIRRL